MNKSAILFILSVAVGVAMMGLGIIWPLIPVYAVELGAGGFLVGLIVASFNVSRTLLSPFSGSISDKWGRKRFIASGLLIYAVLSIFYVLPKNAETLILIRLLHGMASLLVVPVAMALTADIAPPRKLGLYMGTLNMAIMIGLGFGPAMGGMIRDTLGLNAAFYIMGGLALLTSLVVAVFIPADKTHLSDIKRPEPYPIRKIITHKTAFGILIMRFFAASGQGSVYTFLPILAMKINLSSSQVGIILTMNIFLIAFLQRISGGLADRINPKHLIIIGTFACGITVIGMPFFHGFIPILILNILMGMANGLSLPGGLVITGRLGQTMGMASIMSLNDAAWGLGFIVSPILSGLILDWMGVSYVFIVGSILILLGGIAVTVFLWDYDNTLNAV
ncbi:MFS transporter [uncultured Desulfobacter sp.]|uniref:MFS transporter n=1 Tax=uncultured Desulfobacter sp. TaxID=240139 RepID=UPI002AA87A04|nr:MFS transporter [uncultured Desulfobacter sp.]